MTAVSGRLHRRRPTAWRLAAQFFWVLLVARIITGLTLTGLSLESWLTLRTWLFPLGFAVIGVYSYLYWMSHRDD
ncbi:hypothetical protein [Actinomyces qiguomingii]|uniref:hypothetical protein n=1 Tax=Actinomyces qiguomingii TaxID=2057800 RepID=UPI000CA086D0|nr:hypothetical protein [Actinomyces qiguomingii]